MAKKANISGYTVLGTYMSLRDNLFVEPDKSVNGSLSDLQGGKVREKVKPTKNHVNTQSSTALWKERERER